MKELESLADQLGQLLKQNNLKLATAESCTGGGLGFYITSTPGSSEWYDRGFITYSDTAKIDMLNVKPYTLEQFGAVSEQVVREMADGALANSDADLSIAITGIAGPSGDAPGKPVGTVWIAYAGKNITTEAHVDVFPGDRTGVRLGTIKRVLEHLLLLIKT